MKSRETLELGDILKEFRLRAGWTQEELAERAGVATRSVSDIERGIIKAPRKVTVRGLIEALALKEQDRRLFETAARGTAARQDESLFDWSFVEDPLHTDERDAIRSYLQRAEIRLSSLYRTAGIFTSIFTSLTIISLLFSLFVRDSLAIIIKALFEGLSSSLLIFHIPLLWAFVILSVLPMWSVYLLLKGIINFYFLRRPPGFAGRLPSFSWLSLGPLALPSDESARVKHEVMVLQYNTPLSNLVYPSGEYPSNAEFYEGLLWETIDTLAPSQREVSALRQKGVISSQDPLNNPDANRNIAHFNAALGLAGLQDKLLVEEAASMEVTLARCVLMLRHLILQHVTVLLLVIWSTFFFLALSTLLTILPIYFSPANIVGKVNSMTLAIGVLTWALLTPLVVRAPSEWLYSPLHKANTRSLHATTDLNLRQFIRRVTYMSIAAGSFALPVTIAIALL